MMIVISVKNYYFTPLYSGVTEQLGRSFYTRMFMRDIKNFVHSRLRGKQKRFSIFY